MRFLHAVAIGCRNESARCGDANGGKHPPRDRLAMQQLFVLRGRLNRMAERVPEIQNHAQSRLALISINHICLHTHAGRHDISENLRVTCKNAFTLTLEQTRTTPDHE